MSAGLAETHISTVLFAGDRAYKLLKPVKLGFLDYSTPALRLEAANKELQLNRRIAPDVYLGLADVIEGHNTTDRFIVMKRMPTDRCLSTLLNLPGFEQNLRKVARLIARFHSSLEPIRNQDSPASGNSVRRNWDNNVRAMIPHVGSIFDSEVFGRISLLYGRFLESRAQLFEQRIEAGLVRDGHGDLTADDIFCLDDGPRILDCLAFDDSLRISDILLDTAFLAMDVERLAGQDAADWFMRSYMEFSNEHHPASLLHHYVAYRAHVRAKVACVRFEQGDESSAALARSYLDLCLRHLEAAAVKLVLVGGAPGTGKTTLANELAAQHNWVVLNSDELRKDLAGQGHREYAPVPFGEGMYSDEFTQRTYSTMLDQAGQLLRQGESVVLDASWPTKELREQARATAASCGADLFEYECELSVEECQKRIKTRSESPVREDASDATPAMVESALSSRDVWPGSKRLKSVLPIDDLVSQIDKDLRSPIPIGK